MREDKDFKFDKGLSKEAVQLVESENDLNELLKEREDLQRVTKPQAEKVIREADRRIEVIDSIVSRSKNRTTDEIKERVFDAFLKQADEMNKNGELD